MATASDLIDEVIAQMHGYGTTADRVTALTTAIPDATTLTFTVDATTGPTNGLSPGLVQIGSELVNVESIDFNTNQGIVAPSGRGYEGTAATAHDVGELVTSRPRFPRFYILKTINEVIGGVFPDLFAVKTWTGVVTWPSNTYTLPSIPLYVIDAQWQDPVGNWQSIRGYKVDPFDGTLRIAGGALIGRPLRVVYATEPGSLSAETDSFEDITGLPTSCADVIMLGAIAKFIVGSDIARAQIDSVEQSDRSKLVPAGTQQNTAKWLTANFQARLDNEALSLRRRYKPRMVGVW